MEVNIYFNIQIVLCHSTGHEDSNREMRAEEQQDFFTSAADIINDVKESLSPSTISNYEVALRSFEAYAGNNVTVDSISADVLKGFERHLRKRNVSQNTSSCYMRSLRSLLTKMAGKEKCHLFDEVYTGKANTQKRAITEQQLSAIKHLQLQEGSYLCLARDIFLFSYYACGMPFVDIAFMRKDQIANGKLSYFRRKTGVGVSVTLEPCMTEIINRYKSDERESVFPFITANDEVQAYAQYLKALNHYNRTLKTLAKKAGISQNLTAYVARHSWASSAFAANVDMPVISKALGHTDSQTTKIYIKEINDDRLAEANREIIDRI